MSTRDAAPARRVDEARRRVTESRRRAAESRRKERLGRAGANGVGMLLGYALDSALGDPRRLHPVAGYQRLVTTLERRTYADDRRAGARHAGLAVGIPVAFAAAATLATRRRPLLRTALVAVATWTVLGGTSSRREATAVADALDAGDLDTARRRLPTDLASDVSTSDEMAQAAVRAVAEDTSTAVVGPLMWGAVAGLPGLVGYRAVSTLGAMTDPRLDRYERFGVTAARADDAVNLVPTRFTAALTVAAAPLVEGSPVRSAWAWFRDGSRPRRTRAATLVRTSPHGGRYAGQVEAAMAGALGIRTVYSGQTARRPMGGRGPADWLGLGAGRAVDRLARGGDRPPTADDIRRATTVSRAVGVAALVLCVGHVLGGPWRRRQRAAARRRPDPAG